MEIIQAEERHIPAIQQIYAYHVLHGCATFETQPPDEAEMAFRLKRLQASGLPWFVAVVDGNVRGYCYLARYRERHAYRFTLEDSVYIDANCQGQGIGKKNCSRMRWHGPKRAAFASSLRWWVTAKTRLHSPFIAGQASHLPAHSDR